jgi:hypothetical protein
MKYTADFVQSLIVHTHLFNHVRLKSYKTIIFGKTNVYAPILHSIIILHRFLRKKFISSMFFYGNCQVKKMITININVSKNNAHPMCILIGLKYFKDSIGSILNNTRIASSFFHKFFIGSKGK